MPANSRCKLPNQRRRPEHLSNESLTECMHSALINVWLSCHSDARGGRDVALGLFAEHIIEVQHSLLPSLSKKLPFLVVSISWVMIEMGRGSSGS